jgi:DNA-directed RNA polymerase subunit M/transcription elongation factor TFIIS
MSISVKCQDCGKGLKAPDTLAGKKAKCPQCGAVVPIPMEVVDAEEFDDEPPPLPSKSMVGTKKPSKPKPAEDEYDDTFDDLADDEADAPAVRTEKRKPCPMCGEMISGSAAKCRFCGEVFDERVKRSGRRRSGSGEYAGFGTRFVAAFVDGIVVSIIGATLGFLAGAIIGGAMGAGGGNVAGAEKTLNLVGNLIGLLVGWLYSALQESSETQATFGKKMMGIVVTDLDGNRISFGMT